MESSAGDADEERELPPLRPKLFPSNARKCKWRRGHNVSRRVNYTRRKLVKSARWKGYGLACNKRVYFSIRRASKSHRRLCVVVPCNEVHPPDCGCKENTHTHQHNSCLCVCDAGRADRSPSTREMRESCQVCVLHKRVQRNWVSGSKWGRPVKACSENSGTLPHVQCAASSAQQLL